MGSHNRFPSGAWIEVVDDSTSYDPDGPGFWQEALTEDTRELLSPQALAARRDFDLATTRYAVELASSGTASDEAWDELRSAQLRYFDAAGIDPLTLPKLSEVSSGDPV